MQAPNGSWQSTQDGSSYPTAMTSLAGMAFLANGNTTSRGPYSESVRKAVRFVVAQQTGSGLITVGEELGRPMYGHGFSLLFLSCAYGMETDAKVRDHIREVVTKGIGSRPRARAMRGGGFIGRGAETKGASPSRRCRGCGPRMRQASPSPSRRSPRPSTISKCASRATAASAIRSARRANRGPRSRRPPFAACTRRANTIRRSAKACLNYVEKQMKPQLGSQLKGNWGHDFYMNLYAVPGVLSGGGQVLG